MLEPACVFLIAAKCCRTDGGYSHPPRAASPAFPDLNALASHLRSADTCLVLQGARWPHSGQRQSLSTRLPHPPPEPPGITLSCPRCCISACPAPVWLLCSLSRRDVLSSGSHLCEVTPEQATLPCKVTPEQATLPSCPPKVSAWGTFLCTPGNSASGSFSPHVCAEVVCVSGTVLGADGQW